MCFTLLALQPALLCALPEAWPPLNAVRELATQLKKLRKGRESDSDFSPFVAVDLAKFLPDDFAEFKPVRLDSPPRWSGCSVVPPRVVA